MGGSGECSAQRVLERGEATFDLHVVASLDVVAWHARVPAPAPGAAPPVKPNTPAPVADEAKVCRSPIAGTVAKVPVQVGQAIHVNDVLMVLEAMKMETVITAPIAGKVAKINAKVGDFVQGGQVLVEFE